MNTRELGTLAFRLLAVFEILAAINSSVNWIGMAVIALRPSTFATSSALSPTPVTVGGLVVMILSLTVLLGTAKFLWERAPALAYMCLVPLNAEGTRQESATNVDTAALAFSCLGAWILVTNIPQLIQDFATLILSQLTPRGPGTLSFTTQYTLPLILAASLRVLCGFYLLFRAGDMGALVKRLNTPREPIL